jgi:hypothetical protein
MNSSILSVVGRDLIMEVEGRGIVLLPFEYGNARVIARRLDRKSQQIPPLDMVPQGGIERPDDMT